MCTRIDSSSSQAYWREAVQVRLRKSIQTVQWFIISQENSEALENINIHIHIVNNRREIYLTIHRETHSERREDFPVSTSYYEISANTRRP